MSNRATALATVKAIQAKAALRASEPDAATAEWLLLGEAMDRARLVCLLSIKQFADLIDRDEAQCRRWFKGLERPQADLVLVARHPKLPHAYLVELAKRSGEGVEVITQITLRGVL